MNKTDILINITFTILGILLIISFNNQGYINGVSIWNLQSFILTPILIIIGYIDIKKKNMWGILNITRGILQVILIIFRFI